jgi:hypothetical protein
MSRKIAITDFGGYDGPIYVSSIETLRKSLEVAHNCDGELIGRAAQRVAGFTEELKFPQTNDGYRWLWGYVFTLIGRGEMVILIPWTTDSNKTDGSSFSRSIVVYAKGPARINEIAAVVKSFSEAFFNEVTEEFAQRKKETAAL